MTGPAVEVREARPSEYDRLSELTVAVYRDDGFARGAYLDVLADVSDRAAHMEVLVALRGGDLVGSVSLTTRGGPYGERSRPGEAVFRMLAVAPEARGVGVGEALVRTCLERSAAAGCSRVVIFTQKTMHSAHRLYERTGFTRAQDRDWSPEPGIDLLAYSRVLDDLAVHCDHCGQPTADEVHARCRAARILEPPRFCIACGRRLVVQVTPGSWSATCREHGTRRG